jgi:hypothetical protein
MNTNHTPATDGGFDRRDFLDKSLAILLGSAAATLAPPARDPLGARMKMVRVRGPAGSYEVPLHAAPLHTWVLQGVGLSIGMTLFRAGRARL